ncbi:MAG: hypothetical protein FJX68_19080, partial [Alphaproteobacteria bacterium]|nr:hypothetical protein [Alphaproteobacteria bacterium]
MRWLRRLLVSLLFVVSLGTAIGWAQHAEYWRQAWPRTAFERHLVPLSEFADGGPPKDGIPPIDRRLAVADAALAPGPTAETWHQEPDGRRRPCDLVLLHERA